MEAFAEAHVLRTFLNMATFGVLAIALATSGGKFLAVSAEAAAGLASATLNGVQTAIAERVDEQSDSSDASGQA